MPTPQSWNDFPIMDPMDPRALIQKVTLDDNTGTGQPGSFTRSNSWNKTVTWVNPVLKISDISTSTTPFIQSNTPQDYQSFQEAITWNATRMMTAPNPKLPLSVKKIVFLKSGMSFDNIIFLDFIATTSTDVQISFRDNSVTSGQLTDVSGGAPTVPVFAFPTTATYGGSSRKLTVTLTRPGRYTMCIRVVDAGGNYSMFEMDWLVF